MNSIISFFVFFILLTTSFISYAFTFNTAFGDGLFMEELVASLGDRQANLLIKMSPPVVTTDLIQKQSQKPEILFRLYDSKTNQTFKEVTYYITIEKNGKQLMSDWFYDPNGDLTLQMQPRNTSQIRVSGDLDPILNAYTSQGAGPVVASGPIFLEGGLYNFIVRIVTVDYVRTILPDDQQPVFDGGLSVGAYQNKSLDIEGKPIPIEILSYYDKINNISYVPSSNAISFDMPFDYNTSRLNDTDNNVYIHQEVYVPRPSALSSSGGYTGFVNGMDVTNNLVVDGSNETKDVVHFMLTKPIVLQIASQHNQASAASAASATDNSSPSSIMNFSLIPSETGSKSTETPMDHTAMMMPPQ
jgi:hypothetical protein